MESVATGAPLVVGAPAVLDRRVEDLSRRTGSAVLVGRVVAGWTAGKMGALRWHHGGWRPLDTPEVTQSS